MIRRTLTWFLLMIGVSRDTRKISKKMGALEVRIIKLQREKIKSDKALAAHRSQIQSLRDSFLEEVVKLNKSVDQAAGLNERMTRALAAAQEDLETATEITIPGLVAANKVLIDRWDAESAVLATRHALASEAHQRE